MRHRVKVILLCAILAAIAASAISTRAQVATVSAQSPATVPAPTSLTVAANAGYPGQATLTWVKNSGVTTQNGFQYRYEEGNVAPAQESGWDISWTDVPGSTGATTTYTVIGLKAGTQYYFQVRSKNTGNLGESSPVSGAGATTAAPTLAAPTTSDVTTTSLTLAWTAPSAINAAFTAYRWQYRYKKSASGGDFTTATGGAPWTSVPDSSRDSDSDAHNETQASITGLTSATGYEFQVRIDFSGSVGESAAATVTTTTHLPGITPTVAATTGIEGSLTASWTIPAGLTLDSIEYAYLHGTHTSLPPDIEWTEVTDSDDPADGSADETSQVISGLNTGNNYTVWVRGVKAGFTTAAPTAVTAATSGLWTPTGLGFPTTGGIETNRLRLTWHAGAARKPSSALTGVNSIEIRCEPSNNPGSVRWVRRPSTTSGLSSGNLRPNNEYVCSVRSGSAAPGQPADRYSTTATIVATTLPAVAAPASLTVAAKTGYPGQATLTWVKNTDVTTQTGFQYRFAEGAATPADGNWDQDWTDVPGSTASTLSYELSGLKAGTQYYFQVRSKNPVSNGPSAAVSQAGTTEGATVATPTTSNVTTTSLTLAWTRPATLNATFTAYEWQYRYKKTASGSDFTTATGGAPWTSVPDSTRDSDSDAHNETQTAITGLTAATEYEFQVRINFSGDVGESAASSATVSTLIPSIMPTATSPGEGQLVVTWSLPAGVTVDSLEYAYRLGTLTALPADIIWAQVSDSDTPPDGNADERRQVIAGLNTGNAYTVWVRGIKAGATSETPTAATATTNGLPTPTGLSVSQRTNSIGLRIDSIPSGRGATYLQYQCVVSGRPASLTWNERRATFRFANVQGLTSNTDYDCRIRVRSGGSYASSQDSHSSTVFVTTKTLGYVAPTLTAAKGTALGSIDLSWTMPQNHQPSPLTFSYRYEKGTSAPTDDSWDSGTGWQAIDDSNYDSSNRAGTFTLTGLDGAETYLIELRVQYSGTNPQPSSTTANARGVDGPTSLTVAASTGYPGQAQLTWVKNTARTTHTGFQYRYEEGSSAPENGMWDHAWTDVPGSDANTTTYAVNGLKASTQYTFQVRAVHSGNVGKSEPVSQAGTAAAVPTVSAPTTSNVAGVSLTLNWTNPAALNSMFTAYEWQYRYRVKPADPATAWAATWTAVPDSAADADTDAHNESSIAVTGLTGLTEYEFQVRINFTGSVGETAASAAASATTLIPSITPTVAATSGSDNSLSVSWTLPAGVTLIGFEYAYRLGTHTSLPSDITWQDVPDSTSDGRADETAQAIAGLDSGTAYTIWVRGEKTGSTSADPRPATASTSGPWRPTGLTATAGGTEIALDWDDRPSAGAAAHFEHKCEPTASPTSTGWTAIAATTSAATVSSLTVNTAYTCSLRSRTGSSAPYAYSSQAVTATTTTLAHLAPTLTASTGTDLRSISLTWTIPAGYESTLSGFQFRYDQGSAAPGDGVWTADWTNVPDSADLEDSDIDRHNERAFTITGLVGNTGYYIELRAQYGTDTSAESSDTAPAKAVAAPTVNAPPIDLTIDPDVHPGTIALTWFDTSVVTGQRLLEFLNPPQTVTIYGPPAYRTGYEYRYEKGSVAPTDGMWDQDWTNVPDEDDPADGRANEESVLLTGLEFNTAYYIQLRSQNSGGYGDSEIASRVRTSGASPATIPTPTAPTTTTASVTLQWSDLSGVVHDFTDYNWQYRYRIKPTVGTPAWTATWNDVADGTDTGNSAHDENRVIVTGLSSATEYEFQIRIKAGDGASDPSTTVTAKTDIPSITPTVVAGSNDNSLAVSWTIPAGLSVDGFEYTYRQGTFGNDPGSRATWYDVADSGSDGRANETSATITGLDSGTVYTVWLRGEKSGFAASSTVAVTRTTSGPWRPTGFSVTRAARSLTLAWASKPASASVDNFQYKCATSNLAGASWSTTADSTATSVTVSGLTTGASYMCTIRSRAGSAAPYAYSSPDISPVTATTLAFLPPEAATASTGAAKGAVALSWRVPGAASGLLSGFEYRYKKSSDAAYPTTGSGSWASAGVKTATSFQVTGLDGNIAYDFQLRSVFGTSGHSDATADLSTTSGAVAAPTSLAVAARSGYPGQAVLTWVKNTAVTTQNGYQYRYEEGSSAPSQPSGWDTSWTDVPGSTGATTTYTVTGLKAGTTYYFQVRSTNPGTDGASAPVSQSGATTAAPTVAAPTTSSVTATSLTLSWTRPAAINAAFTAYQWQYRYRIKPASPLDAWTATWNTVADTSGDGAHNESSVSVTSISGTREYQFQVRIDFTGSVGESAASSPVAVKTPIPSITPSVVVATGSDNALTVTWTALTGGTPEGYEYAYQQGTHTSLPSGISWNDVPDSGSDGRSNETSQTISSLPSGTVYTVWVRGEKTGFTSAAPVGVTATTSGPWRPTNFTATAGATDIALDWDDRPSANVATHFEYKCEPTASPTSSGWTAFAATTSADTATGLTVNTAYTCSLRSRTGSTGSYKYSSPDLTETAMTLAHLVPTLTATAGTDLRTIALSWTFAASYESTLSGFQYRYEKGTSAPGDSMWDVDWTDVPDNTDAGDPDTDRHDERAYTITGLVGNTDYYIELRAQYGVETSAESNDTAIAKAVGAPTISPPSPNPDVHPGAIELGWTDAKVATQRLLNFLQPPQTVTVYVAPTYRTGYEYRYEKSSAAPTDGVWDQDWTNVDDMDDPSDGRADEDAIALTGLEFNTAYYIQIRSQNSGNYGDSEIASVSRTSGAAPSTIPTPTAPAKTATSVTLQWADLSGVVREFTEYNWQYRYRIKPTSGTPAWTATWNDVADGTDSGDSAHDENRVVVTGLSSATEYEFQIRIKSGSGASSASSTVTAKTTIPSITPTVAAGANDNSLAVSWTIPAGLSVDGFEYAYREGTHGNSPGSLATWHDVADSGSDGRSNETSVTISSLDSGTTYTVWLRGEKSGFNVSGTVAVTHTTSGPWRPTGFSITRGSTSLTLAWDAKPAGASVDNFQYKCAASNLASASWSTTADGNATSVVVSGLTVSTNYTCIIRARTGVSSPYAYSSPALSTKSATTLAFVPPEAPTAATGSASGQVDLTWRVPAAASGQLSGYEYRYKKSSDAAYPTSGAGSWTSAGAKTATSFTVTGLDGNVQYDFQFRSVFGTAGHSTPTSKVSARSGAVAAPASLAVAPRTGYPGQATLTWTKNTGVSTQNGFQYRYEEGLTTPSDVMWDQDWTDVPGSTGTTLTHNVTGLKAGRFYYFQVRSKNTGNNGESNPASRSGNTTPIPSVTAPTTSSVTATSLTLSWSRPTALNSSLTAYQWQYRYKKTASGGAFTAATGGAPWTAVADSTRDADSDAHNETQIDITGLSGTTGYEFQVRMDFTGAVGESAPSSSASVKTLIPSITPTVAVPSGSDVSLTVMWSAPSGGTLDGFEYAYKQGAHTSIPAGIMWNDVPDSGTDGRANETSQTISGLHSGTAYTVWLRGEKTGFISADPPAVTQSTSGPWRPTGFIATASGTSIALDWDDRPSATGAAHFEYKCEPTSSPTNGGWTPIVASTSAATVSSLSVNTAYTCSLRSRTRSSAPYNYSSPVEKVAAMTAAHLAPTMFSATAGTAVGSIDLSWQLPSAYDTSSLSSFQYRYEKGSTAPSDNMWDSGAGWRTIALTGFTASTRMGSDTITGLTGNTGYYIELRAVYGTETSATVDTTETSKAVGAPSVNARTQDPSGQVHPGAITIAWTHSTVETASRTGYQYRYEKGTAAPSDGNWDQGWANVPDMDDPPDGRADETTITLTGLEFNTDYFIQVRSEHSGEVGYSDVVGATRTSDAEPATLPTASTSMASTTSMRLSWTALTGVVAEFTEYSWQYRYRVKPVSGNPAWTATWNSVADSSDAGTSPHDETGVTVTGLTASTEYEFQVRIKSGDGASGASNTVAAKTLIPSITPTVAATSGNDRELTVTWTIPSGGTLDGFEYAHRQGTQTSLPSDITWTDVPDSGTDGRANETSQAITGLYSGTTYTVWVRGEKSGFTSATPTRATTNTSGPWRPTGFSATPAGTSIALDWDDRPTTAGQATHFEYKCEPTSSPTSSGWDAIAASTSAATVSSLTVDTAYTCSLRSRTGFVGSYTFSSPVETKTAMTAAHLAPTLSATAGTAVGSINLSWTLPSGFDASSLSSFEYRYEQGSAAPADSNWDSGSGWQTLALSTFNSGSRAGSHTLSGTGITGNTQYYFQMRAVYGTESSASDDATATARAVAAPTSFTVGARSAFPGQLAASWQDATNTDRTGYQYRYDEGATSPADNMWDQDWTAVPSSGTATRSFNISGLKAGTGYYVEVRSTHGNNKGNSVEASGTATATAVPTLAAPTTSAVSTTSATLAWTRPANSALDSGITTYKWQYRYKKTASGGDFTTATGGAPWTDVADSTRDGDSHAYNETQVSLTSLTAATEYQFQVRINFDDSNWGETAAVSVTSKTLIPMPSISVSAATDPGSVSIDIGAYASGVTVDKFQVRRVNSADSCATSTASGWTGWTDISGNGSSAITHTISSLTPNTRWKFEVRPQKTGFTSAGTACESLMLSMVPAPTGFTAANVSNTPGSVKLDWTGPSSSTIANFAYRYKVTQGGGYTTATGGVAWTDVPDGSDAGSLTSDERTITLTGLKASTGYTVQLRVEYSSALGDSGPVSATVTTLAVQPPTSVSATSTANSVTVSWTASTSVGVSRIDSRHRKTGASWSNWTTNGPAAGTTSLTISSLDGASEYQVEVRANVSNAVGNSAAASVTQKTRIPAISNLAEDSATQNPGTITLKWDALGDNARVGKFQYRYERGTAVPTDGNWDQSWTDISANGSAAVTHAVSGLAATSDYYFQVQAVKTGYTSVSANLTGTSGSHITLAGVSASASTAPGSVALSWTKPSHSNIQEYRYRFKKASDAAYPTSGTGAWATVSGGATPSSITVTNLTNNVSHNFEVLAYYGSVTGSSTAGSATASSQVLPAPSGFNAEQGTLPGSIALTWNSMASTSEVGKFQYRFEQASAAPADNMWDQDWTDVPSSTRSTTTFQITGRTAGATFLIQLRAVGTGIIGVSGTAQDTSTATTAPAPTGFSASTGSDVGEIDITWNAGAGISQYQYRYKQTTVGTYPTSGAGAWTSVPDQDTPPDGQGDETAYTVTGLVPGVEYHIQIRAQVTNVGSSAATTAQSVTVKSVAAPMSFSASAGSSPGSIGLRWSAIQSSNLRTGDSILQYEYRYKLQTETQYGQWTAVPDGSDANNLASDETSAVISNLSNGKLYDIQLRGAIDDNDADSMVDYYTDSASRTGITARIVPVPSNFRGATSSSAAGAIDLSWIAQTAITASSAQFEYRYKLTSATSYRSWTSVTDGEDGGSNTWDEVSATISALTAETSYDIQLRFFVSNAVGASAATSTTATASRVPSAMNFNVNPGGAPGSINLSWEAVDGATKYEYRCNPAGTGCTANWQEVPDGTDADSSQANETAYTVTGLTPGVRYTLELRAFVDDVGYGGVARSSSLAQTQPGPDTISFTQGDNPGEVTITWTAPTQGSVARYEFQHRISGTQYNAWADAGTSPYTITGLHAGSRYDVRFRVVTPSGGYSLPNVGTLNTKPVPPPTGFTAAMGSSPGEVDLGWSIPSGVTILRFEYRYRTGTGSWSSWSAVPDQDDPPNNDAGDEDAYRLTELSGGASYTIELRAVMQTVGHSESVSATVSATPIPPPTEPIAEAGEFPGDIAISWTAAAGATTYQFRAKLQSETWTTEHSWASVAAPSTSATISGLAQGQVHDIEIRAVIANVGYSPVATTTATSQEMVDGTAEVPAGYAVSAARVPGKIVISLPTDTEAVVYRTQPTNPGAWSPYIVYRPSTSEREFEIPNLKPGTEYNVEAHFYLAQQQEFTEALRATVRTAPLAAPANFRVESTNGVMLLSWDGPGDAVEIEGYEYRTRLSGSSTWSEWKSISGAGSGSARRQHYVPGMLAGAMHDFELRVRTSVGPGPVASASASAMLRLPTVTRIEAAVTGLTVRTDSTVMLELNVYGSQNGLSEDVADELLIYWYATGDGYVQDTTTGPRTVYRAPSQPGYYTVTATAGPAGICRSHHVTVSGPDPCEAKFTIQVTSPPQVPGFSAIPQNPPGVIPETILGEDSLSYTTITPESGGLVSAAGATIRAGPAAIRSGEYIGVRITEGNPVGSIGQDVTSAAEAHDAYIGYRTHTLAGNLYSFTVTDSEGELLDEYELVLPAVACVPLPSNLEDYTGRIVLAAVGDDPDTGLTVLGSRTYTTSAYGMQACASVRVLPVTVAAAIRGIDESLLPLDPTGAQLPDAGSFAPNVWLLIALLLAGLAALSAARLLPPRPAP